MLLFNYAFYILILVVVIQILNNKNSFQMVIFGSLLSLFVSFQYIFFNAPDVAITEASIGVCLNTIFALKFLNYSNSQDLIESGSQSKNFYEKNKFLKFAPYVFLIFFLGVFFVLSNQEQNALSIFGNHNNIIYNDYIKEYISHSEHNLKIKNIVTAVLAYFRGYDTLIESLVILTAGIGVSLILPVSKIQKNEIKSEKMSKSYIIYHMAFFFIPFIILFAFYLQAHGEESPGGGFQAGAVLTCAFILYALTISEDLLLYLFSIKNLLRVGAFGCLIYLFVGIFPILASPFLKNFFNQDNLFLNYNYLFCLSKNNILDNSCHFRSQKLGIFLVEIGVGICVFATTFSLFLNLKYKKE